MSDIETMLNHCGFDSAFEMIKHHFTEEEMMDLLNELLTESKSTTRDTIEEIATEHYEWVEWEQIADDADHTAMQEWKDRRHGDE